jgi:hypothetical protein
MYRDYFDLLANRKFVRRHRDNPKGTEHPPFGPSGSGVSLKLTRPMALKMGPASRAAPTIGASRNSRHNTTSPDKMGQPGLCHPVQHFLEVAGWQGAFYREGQ